MTSSVGPDEQMHITDMNLFESRLFSSLLAAQGMNAWAGGQIAHVKGRIESEQTVRDFRIQSDQKIGNGRLGRPIP